MKNILLIAFAFLCSISLSAQTKETKTTVVTKEGSLYKGELINENIFDVKLLLETGDTIIIDKGSVKNILMPKDDVVYFDKGKYHETSGLFYSMRFDFTAGASENSSSSLSFVAGKRLNEKWHVGLGYGFSTNSARVPGNWFVNQGFQHVFAYGRYNIKFAKKLLFVDTDLGYGFSSSEDFLVRDLRDGIYAKPSIGIEFGSAKRLKWSIKLSQFMQSSGGRIENEDSFGNAILLDYKQFYNRTMIGVGITW